MGEEVGDYYKIVPSHGAYLWVNTEYTNPIASAVGRMTVEPMIVTKPEPESKSDSDLVSEPEIETPVVVPTNISVEANELEKYYAVQKQIKAENAKPLEKQDYSRAKKVLSQIARNKEAGKATRYAEFAIRQIERFELAAAVSKQTQLQDAQLQEIYERIDKAHAKRLQEFQDLGKFAVIGTLKISNVYGPQAELLHYLIVDDAGKIICYALPGGAVSIEQLHPFINEKVGLAGTIEPHPQTAGPLVKFTGIEKIR